MNKIKSCGFFRVISLVLILTFISFDISYAYPPERNAGNSTLAAPSLLQQQPVNEHAARFQQSIFSQGALLASVFDIGEYFFGRPERDMEPLPSRYAEEVVKAGLGKLLAGSGIEILNIVPVEYLKKTVPEKLQSALSEISFKGTLPNEGVVFILYRKGDKKFLVQIAKKDEVSPGNLPGYKWVVSDKYVVKYVPEDYKEEMMRPTAIVEKTQKTKVCFIGVGSPNHYNMWNNLSLETLAGDLKGAFGDGVAMSMLWTNRPEEIDLIVNKAMADAPDIIGISIQPGSMEIIKLLVEKLNSEQAVKDGKIMVAFGNQIPTYIPEKFIDMCPQGIVIRGEGEIALRSLVRVAKGELKLSDVPSAVYKDRESGNIVHTKIISPKLESLEYTPTTDTYEEIARRGGNVQVQASRGCPWGGCAYCTRSSFRRGGIVTEKGKTASWEGFTVERVLKTLDDVMARGITEVEFSDDEFIGGRKDENIDRIIAIADGIERLSKKHGIKFSFRVFTRPNIIYKEGDPDNKNEAIRQLMLKLKHAGLVRVFVGIEAGNDTQLKRYARGMKLSETTEAIKILKEMGLGIDSGFIMFDPELTVDEMIENVRYFRENKLIESNQWPFRPMAINHGSRMVGRLQKEGLLGEENINLMSYEYIFKNSSIEKIARIIDDISKKTRTIFYALKVKSKIFDPDKKDEKTILCQKYIEDNGLIYLDLMEDLGRAVQNGATQEEIDAITRKADEKVVELAKDVSDDIARGRISDEDDYLKKELAKIGIKDNVAGLSFYPSRDFAQGKPLNASLIIPRRTPEEAVELLKKARDKGIELSITGHLRGFDGAGSSLDLPEFQRALTAIGATDLRDLPSTPTIASEFTVKVRFELTDDPAVIEYVAPDYGITESNPYRIKGEVNLTSTGRTPNGQKDAPAFIFRNIFGLKGIKVVCESISPMALAGGMESSNVFNASLIAAASMLSGADLSMSEIFSLSVKLENDEFGGLTGGQGHLCWMLGGAYRHVWLSGVKDVNGCYINPYAAFSLSLLTQDDLTSMEEHMMIGQAGKEYVDGKAQIGRTAALVNFMWTDLLRDKDEIGLPLHKEKLGLADKYVRALKEKNFAVVVDIMNRYVDIRDQLCKRWTALMLDARQGKPVPEYAKAYADKVFNLGNPAYADYETIRKMYAQYGEGLRDVSLYAPGPIAEIVRAGRKEGMAVLPLGAGGPGANIIAISPKSAEYIRKFFESQGLGLLTEDNVRKIVRGTGMLKGYMLFKVGRDPVTFDGFEAVGMKIPASPTTAQYDQWTGKFTPMAKPSSTSATFESEASPRVINAPKSAIDKLIDKWVLPRRLPSDSKADYVVALGTSIRKDGAASTHSRAIAEECVRLYKAGIAPKIIFSGGYTQNGVTEAEAMRRVAVKMCPEGEEDFIVDRAPNIRYGGTAAQVYTVADAIARDSARPDMRGLKIVSVTQYLHSRRANATLKSALSRYGIGVWAYPAEKSIYEKDATQPQLRFGEKAFFIWEALNYIRFSIMKLFVMERPLTTHTRELDANINHTVYDGILVEATKEVLAATEDTIDAHLIKRLANMAGQGVPILLAGGMAGNLKEEISKLLNSGAGKKPSIESCSSLGDQVRLEKFADGKTVAAILAERRTQQLPDNYRIFSVAELGNPGKDPLSKIAVEDIRLSGLGAAAWVLDRVITETAISKLRSKAAINKSGAFIVLSGFSGTGKGTLFELLSKVYSDRLAKIVLYTTRGMRNSEKNGREYNFVSSEDFDKLSGSGGMVFDNTQGNMYGVLKKDIELALVGKNIAFIEVSYKMQKELKAEYPQHGSIFVLPMAGETIEKMQKELMFRLGLRDTDNEVRIAKRLHTAIEELPAAANYDQRIVNYRWNVLGALNDLVDAINRIGVPEKVVDIIQKSELSGKELLPEAPEKYETEKAETLPATQFFDIVESALVGKRAEFIETGNGFIGTLSAQSASDAAANIGTLDKKMATAEIKQRVERAIAAIESLGKEGITPEAKVAMELLKKNLNQFEADGGVASIIVLARKAKRENQKLIIGLETDWIPAINKERSLQKNAISALMKEMHSIGEALQSMGLDNVEIIRGSGSQLADSLMKASEDSNTDMRNIVVMASKDTITSDSFKVFRDAGVKDRPFLTGIDPAELIKLYEEFGELVSKQLHIKLTTLLYMTLEAAAGKEPPNAPWIQYDSVKRILILVPSAEPKDYEDLKNAYKAEAAALQSA
ncbi:MAG: radical SAM protein [Candidatus Omnitrophota bacterium]|nr:radical SAM protein [Candidatus Omnitrophota bacterium]